MKNKIIFLKKSKITVLVASLCALFAAPVYAQVLSKSAPATSATSAPSATASAEKAAPKKIALKAKAPKVDLAAIAAYEAEQAQFMSAAQAVMRASFKERGQVKLDRLDQDGTQELCSKAAERENTPGYKFTDSKFIEAANLKTLRFPVDGVFLGDWKEGEKIAQLGVGKQFSDDPTKPSGGNCYACHQLDPTEISYGNLGPSLYQYGKLRGNTEAIQKYTYGKIYNSNAYSACSNMPRFGHTGILTAEQIKHVTALLLDPQSPVNAK